MSENETRMYTLCTLNGKELDTGHNSSPNSELWYCFIIFQDYLNIKILKFFENFEIIYEILKMFWNFVKFWNLKFFENVDLFCNLIGRLEMKSRFWLDNVETPNRQETKIDTSLNIPHARCTHSEVELRKCCLPNQKKAKFLII